MPQKLACHDPDEKVPQKVTGFGVVAQYLNL